MRLKDAYTTMKLTDLGVFRFGIVASWDKKTMRPCFIENPVFDVFSLQAGEDAVLKRKPKSNVQIWDL